MFNVPHSSGHVRTRRKDIMSDKEYAMSDGGIHGKSCHGCTVLTGQLNDLQAEYDALQEVRAPGTCECSDEDACRFVRQRDELAGALLDALDLTKDIICYVDQYYRDKWGYDERLAALLRKAGRSPMNDFGARIECDCCGRAAAQGIPGEDLIVSDGQPPACGCRGHISVDSEMEPYVLIDDCDCDGESCDAPVQSAHRPCRLARGHAGVHES